jgi:hypothetical protein
MARIEIEDLPVGEPLTPEQEELLFGAGFRPFRPMFEALEAREMMDAAIGHALMAPMPQSGGAAPQFGHVRMLASDFQMAGSNQRGVLTGKQAASRERFPARLLPSWRSSRLKWFASG